MPHITQRQGDEVYCVRCGRRWEAGESPPPDCDAEAESIAPPIVRPTKRRYSKKARR